MKIPAQVRYQRVWNDFKRKFPFTKRAALTEEGEAFLMHLKNLYHGNAAHSVIAKEFVDDVMERTQCDEKEAVESIYLHFYAIGLIDEIELAKLELI